jgi:Tol biopolymer transport system component
LTAYNVRTKQSTDVASDNATQPSISPDGKRLMYITTPEKGRTELWVQNLDGSNKVKLATSRSLGTGFWASDSFHLFFMEEQTDSTDRAYTAAADGSGVRQIPWSGGALQALSTSRDQKSIYLNSFDQGASRPTIWRENSDGSNPEKLTDGCGHAFETTPDGNYLLTVRRGGDKLGIAELSLADKKCTSLLPGAITFGIAMAPDGKSFLYAVPSRSDVTIYRQPWHDGKLTGPTQVAVKLPFAFPLLAGGNAYDFSRDLSTVVYARPAGQADLFLLTQK